MLDELKLEYAKPVQMFVDNKSAISLSKIQFCMEEVNILKWSSISWEIKSTKEAKVSALCF